MKLHELQNEQFKDQYEYSLHILINSEELLNLSASKN